MILLFVDSIFEMKKYSFKKIKTAMRNMPYKPLLHIIPALVMIAVCSGTPGHQEANDSSYASSSGVGSDMYYEYAIKSTGRKTNFNSYMKLYLSSKGNVRMEMGRPVPGADGKGLLANLVVIGNSDKPNETITIDDDKKTYTINHIDADSINNPLKKESVATKIGEEKLLGYNSVHARVISNSSLGSFYKSVDTTDIWRSNDIPVQEKFKSLLKRFESKNGSFMYSTEIAGQLKQMGCDGFMMKFQMRTKDNTMTDELVKVEHRDLPSGLFQIPVGYKEEKE